MSTPKPANQDLSEQISGLVDNSSLETLYEQYMDSMLYAIGRDITIYLPPGQTQSTSNPSQFNPWLQGQDRRLGGVADGAFGSTVAPISVVYKAHIVHGPRLLTDKVPFALDTGEVQITTVIGAKLDLSSAVEIEVDGLKFNQKKVDIRPIGLTTPKYLISVWSRKPE